MAQDLQGSKFPNLVRMEVAPVTTSSTTLQAPYNHVVYTNAGTIAAQTLVLPLLPVDGQHVIISNVAAITALTLTPAASGAPAGLTAGQGLWLMYSSTFATPGWFVVN